MWRHAAELVAVLIAAAPAARAQAASPTLHVAFAHASQRGGVPAIQWFCEHWLGHQPWWPDALDPRGPFRLSLVGGRVSAAPLANPPDAGVACHGSFACGAGPALHFACAADGREDWVVPLGMTVPASWRNALQQLDALALDAPRTLDVAVVAGHLAGGLADGDPRAALLQLGAVRCGEVTWTAWTGDGHLRVRGRSDGGLWLPAALLALATEGGATWNGLAVRAFGARDSDQLEATRGLALADATTATPVLRAMLHADDQARATAIDALVRRAASEQLPAIVAAAAADTPWTTLAAVDAVAALWPTASAEVRTRTRAAIATSDVLALRGLDLRSTPAAAPPPAPAPLPLRTLCWLGASALGLFWLWQRERLRVAAGAR